MKDILFLLQVDISPEGRPFASKASRLKGCERNDTNR